MTTPIFICKLSLLQSSSYYIKTINYCPFPILSFIGDFSLVGILVVVVVCVYMGGGRERERENTIKFSHYIALMIYSTIAKLARLIIQLPARLLLCMLKLNGNL